MTASSPGLLKSCLVKGCHIIFLPVELPCKSYQRNALPVGRAAVLMDDAQPDSLPALQKLYAEGGVGRFYKGFSPCLMRAVPANACMLYTVDKVNSMLR